MSADPTTTFMPRASPGDREKSREEKLWGMERVRRGRRVRGEGKAGKERREQWERGKIKEDKGEYGE